MKQTIETNRPLSAEVVERRRQQNRIAQRKFRQKKDQQRAAEMNLMNTSASPRSNTGQPLSPSSAFQIGNSSFDPGDLSQITSSDLNDTNFWELQIREGLLHSSDTPGSISMPETPSFDLNFSRDALQALPDTFLRYNSSDSRDFDSTGSTRQNPPAQSKNVVPRYRGMSSSSQPLNSSSCDLTGGANAETLSGLHLAARRGHDRIVSVLIQGNMDCNEKDSEGRTALMHAVMGNHELVVQSLLSHGARLNEVDGSQRSVLHLAVIHRSESVLRALLELYPERRNEFDMDAYDDSGRTPFHIAAEEGFESGVVLLLKYGANMNVKAQRTKRGLDQ